MVSPHKVRSPLFNLRKFQKNKKSTGESCRTHRNLMNDEEFGSFQFLELRYRRRDQIIQPFCRICSHQEIRSTVFNLKKFQKIEKSTGESVGTHCSAMNDQEFESLKFLELKYRRRDEIIQRFCRIGSAQEIRSLVFNLKKFQKTD